MKKITLSLASLVLLVTTGCASASLTSDQSYPIAVTNTPATIQSYDIVTTTYTGNDELAVSAIVESGVSIVKTDTGKTTTIPTPSYTAAVNQYGNGRFQFVNCSGTPGTLSIKKGTNFMLDNRDNKKHVFAIGKKNYQLNAYDFALVNVAKAGDYFITCDGGGAAKVSIQG